MKNNSNLLTVIVVAVIFAIISSVLTVMFMGGSLKGISGNAIIQVNESGENFQILPNKPQNFVTLSTNPTSHMKLDSGGRMVFNIFNTPDYYSFQTAGVEKLRITGNGSIFSKGNIFSLGSDTSLLTLSTDNQYGSAVNSISSSANLNVYSTSAILVNSSYVRLSGGSSYLIMQSQGMFFGVPDYYSFVTADSEFKVQKTPGYSGGITLSARNDANTVQNLTLISKYLMIDSFRNYSVGRRIDFVCVDSGGRIFRSQSACSNAIVPLA